MVVTGVDDFVAVCCGSRKLAAGAKIFGHNLGAERGAAG